MASPVPTASWPELAAADANERNQPERFHSKLLGQLKVSQPWAKCREPPLGSRLQAPGFAIHVTKPYGWSQWVSRPPTRPKRRVARRCCSEDRSLDRALRSE